MIVTVNCSHCDQQFDIEAEERSAVCPHCEREVLFSNKKIVAPSGSKSPLRPCLDCSATISRRALWCPQCGSLQRSLFSLIWAIMCEFWLVTFIVGLIGWGILKVISLVIHP